MASNSIVELQVDVDGVVVDVVDLESGRRDRQWRNGKEIAGLCLVN